MLTSENKKPAIATGVRFDNDLLCVSLGDGQEMRLRLDDVHWLDWLYLATDEQRANWSIEPGGFAIYWEDLDDGIELCHLSQLPVTCTR